MDRNGGTENNVSNDGTDNNNSNDGTENNDGAENWDDLPSAPFFDLEFGFYVVEGVHFWTDRAILNALLGAVDALLGAILRRHRG